MRTKSDAIDVSIITPVYNAQLTLQEMLESLRRQEYPMMEIIIVDNHSIDDSVKIVEEFRKRHEEMMIRLIRRRATGSVASSLNMAARVAKSNHIVTMHSDSVLPTKQDLARLIEPFRKDENVIATYSIVLHPRSVWMKYNFWEKCHFARSVDRPIHAMLGKFDCIDRRVFLKLSGYDENNFVLGADASDANMFYRLRKEGKVVPTNAKVIHLHFTTHEFTLQEWIVRRKLLARAYGRLIRTNIRNLIPGGLIFLVKPGLAIGALIPGINVFFIILLICYSFLSTSKMFTTKETRSDRRILLLPFINIFLVYYETFWMVEGLLSVKKEL